MHTELKWQVDDLSLDVKQQCLVPINIHSYEDKFWSYIVTKDVGQIKDVTIYNRSMSENLMNYVVGESNIIQITNFPSLVVKQKCVITKTFPVRRSLYITITVTGKLLCAFRLVHLIIPFGSVDPLNQVSKKNYVQ